MIAYQFSHFSAHQRLICLPANKVSKQLISESYSLNFQTNQVFPYQTQNADFGTIPRDATEPTVVKSYLSNMYLRLSAVCLSCAISVPSDV